MGMRALRILLEEAGIDFASADAFYAPREAPYEYIGGEHGSKQLFSQLHNFCVRAVSGPEQERLTTPVSGFPACYYGVATAASAMTAAQHCDRAPFGIRQLAKMSSFLLGRMWDHMWERYSEFSEKNNKSNILAQYWRRGRDFELKGLCITDWELACLQAENSSPSSPCLENLLRSP